MRESIRESRASLLRQDPGTGLVDMNRLVGIATAVEHESANRYALLAETMARRGEPATAAAFRVMLEEELHHIAAVEHWAAGLDEPLPEPKAFAWQLPAELASSWDEVAGSALLTPFRAFALAVVNEERAFSMYSYLAARAANERVRIEAERLAGEELAHAALMRRLRREAWHRARREPAPPAEPVETIEALRAFVDGSEAAISGCHRAVARRLREIGDDDSAQILERQLVEPPQTTQSGAADASAGEFAAEIANSDDPVRLLVVAQKPLEAFGERLEAIVASAQGQLFEDSARTISSVATRLARISLLAATRAGAPRPIRTGQSGGSR